MDSPQHWTTSPSTTNRWPAPPTRPTRPRHREPAGSGDYARLISPDLDDSALVSAAQGGDRAALDTLLRRHYDRLYAICRRLAGNDADAQDATQEAMIAIAKGLPRYDGRAKFSTWSYRVATNACLDELRRRGRRPTPSIVDEHPEMIDQLQQDTSPAVSDQVTDRLVIADAIRELPEEFRAPIVLRDQLGLEYADIAETLDIAVGTVKSRIARGRRKMAELLATGELKP